MANTSAPVKESRYSLVGTMPKDMLKRHKLVGNPKEAVRYTAFRNSKRVRELTRMTKTYRLLVHGVNEPYLAAPLRNSVQYFCIQMTRADSDNPKDRKGLTVAENVPSTPVAEAGAS